MLDKGPTWHGTALGWPSSVSSCISKIPLISTRFCGVKLVTEGTEFIFFGCVDVQSDGTAFDWYPAPDGTFFDGHSDAAWSLSLCGL